MRLLTAGSLVRVQLGEPKKADTLMRIGFSFAILLTRTNDKLLQICIIANLGETVRWTVSWQVAQPLVVDFYSY